MKKISNKIKSFFKPANKKNRIKWSLYGRVWREVGLPYWKWLLLGIICTVIAAAAEGYSVTLVKKVIDQGFVSQNMNLLVVIGLQIILAFFLKGLFNYIKSLVMSKTGLKTSAALQDRIYRHIIRTNIANIQENGVGKFMNYFGIQAGAVLNLVTGQIIGIVQDLASLLIMLCLMLWYAPQMVMILLFLIPGLIIPLMIITRYRNKKTREYFGIANNSSHHINQTLSGLKTIQAFGMEGHESKQFGEILDRSIINSYKTTKVAAMRAPLMELVISVGLGISLIFAGHFISGGSLTTGDFTAFILALTAAYKPAKSATGINEGIQQGLIAAEVLFDFLDSRPSIRNEKNAIDLVGKKMKVQYKNVSFAYNETDGYVLHDINLTIDSGKICAFVGHSGGGKTTMFNLLERFYDPDKGQILINGKDLKKYTLESLRKNIAEVSQDVFLFNETIEENIRYGKPDATSEEIIEAAKIANAHEFIMELPKKYKTPVGERGSLLSGGQKQRIAIARAVLKDAPILLMDEATSALDTESEKLIQSAMKKLMAGRTTFVIAHRLSTILDADMICVIKDGRIVETGTDVELSMRDGEYKKLRDIQFKKE
ncbi:MAG: ABC transporter ATP-binding protein/permease [Rickettsiales bacterium]|jgi:subfamily B ATP-binding cassette protein MsbA|nr:ABC transporter ATP-binding protein/permease [Rickettsiales bacterium]